MREHVSVERDAFARGAGFGEALSEAVANTASAYTRLFDAVHGYGVDDLHRWGDRVGHVLDAPIELRSLSIWLGLPDLAQLVRIGLEHPDLRYEIFYGASANERCWWDNARAHAFGYRPTGRAEDHRDRALAGKGEGASDPVSAFFEGDSFCSTEFSGRTDGIW